jgi:hypothetical protein
LNEQNAVNSVEICMAYKFFLDSIYGMMKEEYNRHVETMTHDFPNLKSNGHDTQQLRDEAKRALNHIKK